MLTELVSGLSASGSNTAAMRILPVPVLLLLASPLPALADDDDHERALAARERGEVRPLAEILPAVEARFGGRVIEVGFGRDDGRFVYEFELITPDGRLLEAEIDAMTGATIEVEMEDD